MSGRDLQPFFSSLKNNTPALLFLVLLYAAAVAIVGVSGNFPLNDDWSYETAVTNLVVGHNWRPSGWTSATVLTQSLWGSLFCRQDNCSYVNLRISSLCAALVMLPLCYGLFRWARASPWYSALAVVVTLLNPLSFTLQFTFMTETLFGLLMVVSAFAFGKFIDDKLAYIYLGAGCAALIAAILCRQLALSIPLAFLATYPFYRNGDGWPKRMMVAIVPFLLCVATLLLFDRWMKITGRTPTLYNEKSDLIVSALEKPSYFVQRVSWNTTVFLLYLGLFLAPLAVGRSLPRFSLLTKRLKVSACAVAGLFAVLFSGILILRRSLMPISGNILTHQGIGPIFLYGETSHSPPALPLVILLLMTIVSLLSAVWLVFMTAVFLLSLVADPANELKQRETILALLALLTIAAYFIPISSITFYDRYIMPMIPIGCVFVLLASAPPKYFGGMVWLGPILGCLLAVFSVLGTHDYLSWNRARWQALSYLEGPERQTAHNIDGGFEYNGARLYDPKYVPQARKSFWWVDNDTYKVTFNEIAGEQVIAKFEYLGFMPPGKRYIYVLKGNAGDVMAVSKPDPDGNVQP